MDTLHNSLIAFALAKQGEGVLSLQELATISHLLGKMSGRITPPNTILEGVHAEAVLTCSKEIVPAPIAEQLTYITAEQTAKQEPITPGTGDPTPAAEPPTQNPGESAGP